MFEVLHIASTSALPCNNDLGVVCCSGLIDEGNGNDNSRSEDNDEHADPSLPICAIATSLGLPAEDLESYRQWGMYLDDLSCCGEECETC